MALSNNLKKYQSKNPLKQIFLNLFSEKIINIISSLKINSVLDAGCGEGFIIKKILDNQPQIKIEGLDISKDSLAVAKQLLPNINFYESNIADINLPTESYDLVIALEVLEHINNPEVALRELKKITKKYCLISVPWEPFFSIGNILSGKNIKRLGQDPEHLQFWSKKKITKIVSKEFTVISSQISFPWTIILAKKDE